MESKCHGVCMCVCKCVAVFVCICARMSISFWCVYVCIERAENTVKLPPPSLCLHYLYSIISVLTGNTHRHTQTHSTHRRVWKYDRIVQQGSWSLTLFSLLFHSLTVFLSFSLSLVLVFTHRDTHSLIVPPPYLLLSFSLVSSVVLLVSLLVGLSISDQKKTLRLQCQFTVQVKKKSLFRPVLQNVKK